MIKRTFDITARIEQGQIPFCFQCVQGDKDVYALHIRITDGGQEIDYGEISDATITFVLANGAVVQSDPERLAISSGGITYEMGTTEISCPGKVTASIQLIGSGGERLTTARFQFEVVADLISPQAVQSESHFPLLQQLVADVEQLKQDIVDLQIPDNSIMDEKLSDAAGQIKQRFASHMADSVKHITAEERTKWNAIDNLAGWKIYNDITELGLTPGTETMNAIVPAMQNKSELRFIKTTANLADMYPASSGMLIVRKYANYRVECRFMQGVNGIVREWIAYYDVNITPSFTGWKRVVTENSEIIYSGTGSPEGVVTAPVGTLYRRTDGGASTTLYVKESGTGNTGWKAVQTA